MDMPDGTYCLTKQLGGSASVTDVGFSFFLFSDVFRNSDIRLPGLVCK